MNLQQRSLMEAPLLRSSRSIGIYSRLHCLSIILKFLLAPEQVFKAKSLLGVHLTRRIGTGFRLGARHFVLALVLRYDIS